LLELVPCREFVHVWTNPEGSTIFEAALVTLFGKLNTDEQAHLGADAAQQQATFVGIMLFIKKLHADLQAFMVRAVNSSKAQLLQLCHPVP